MIQPTHRADGRELSGQDETAPAFIACIDEPTSTEVATDSLESCRFRGWVASTRGRPMTVVVRVAGDPPLEFPATDPRIDVVAALGPTYGVTDPGCGFCIDVELPEAGGDDGRVPIAIEFVDGEFVARSPEFQIYRSGRAGATRSKQAVASTHLRGEGVEFGALHQPLEIDRRRCVVHYADRLSREDAKAQFPELREYFAAEVVDPDILVDLNRSDLSELGPYEFDFFVANDVIEHLANPVRFLENLHNVMKPGAVLFLSVPDRDYTFDRTRDLTPAEHLWKEHERNVTRVSAPHLRDFIENTEEGGLPRNPWRRHRLYKYHRERSIHVHVWTQASFDDFLARTCERLDLTFEIVDKVESRDAAGSMVYVLRRA
jgi:SAM-dependent methyltransferase